MNEFLFFSLDYETLINGTTYNNEDIIAFDGNNFKQYFDGSDVGIAGTNVDALDIISDKEILLSFSRPTKLILNGVVTIVDDSDIIKFTSSRLGKVTGGYFEMFVDGSEYGLTEDLQDIDAIHLLEDGSLLISTIGTTSIIEGVSSRNRDEDILKLDLDGNTDSDEPWSVYFDGGDVGLNTNTEDIDGISLNTQGNLNLSTLGQFIVLDSDGNNIVGNNVSVFEFIASSLGRNTEGSFEEPVFNGAGSGLADQNINAFSLENSVDLATLDRALNAQVELLLGLKPSAATDSMIPKGKEYSFFSLDIKTEINGVEYRDEDIVVFDGGGLRTYFDGSDVGVGDIDVDAFDVIGDKQILLSFSTPTTITIDGVETKVDDSDIVKFMGTEMGETTEGSFEMFFDGSKFGLTEDMQDIDAVQLLDDDSLLISTIGTSIIVDGVATSDEDILRVQPKTDKNSPLGTWSVYFDGGDVGLYTFDTEDVNAVSLSPQGDIHLSTIGEVEVKNSADGNVIGNNVSVLTFNPSSLGQETEGSFDDSFVFDGADFGLSAQDINAFSLETLI